MTVDEANKIFDKQIRKARENGDEHLEEFNILSKKIFNLTLDISTDDWKIIRTPQYWNELQFSTANQKKRITLNYVIEYLKNKNK
jgi:hypothetical protein